MSVNEIQLTNKYEMRMLILNSVKNRSFVNMFNKRSKDNSTIY